MANELKKLVREAFNTAYRTRKQNIISESVSSLAATMSPEDIAKAEDAFNQVKNNPEAAAKFAWSPQTLNGNSPGKKQAPFNLFIELVHERLDPEVQKRIFMTVYNDNNPALISLLTNKLIGMKGSIANRDEARQAIETAWNEMFLGEKYKSGDKEKKSFSDAFSEYIPGNSNFGAYLVERLKNSASTALRDLFNTEKPASLDAPSQITGKANEFGVEGAFGNDDEYGSDTMGDAGEKDDNLNLDGDQESDSEEDLGDISQIADEENRAQVEAKEMITILIDSINEAISDFRSHYPGKSEKGLSALENVVNTGENPDKISQGLIGDLKKNKVFLNLIDKYLRYNGFTNSRGRFVSFEDLKSLYIAKMVQFLKTGDVSILAGLQESKIWFIDNVLMENFMKNNLDKIMENVYKRLAPKLNS
jgi:hypothetical protein